MSECRICERDTRGPHEIGCRAVRRAQSRMLAEAIYEYANRPQNWETFGVLPRLEELTVVIEKTLDDYEADSDF